MRKAVDESTEVTPGNFELLEASPSFNDAKQCGRTDMITATGTDGKCYVGKMQAGAVRAMSRKLHP
jgi:hypothetical protein